MTILLAPIASSDGQQITKGLFRKQILKAEKLNYNGRVLNFDQAYFEQLAKAFELGAYDSVPFMLADKDNRHTMEPERAAGEVVALEATPRGLDAVIRLSETGRKIVADHPRFGVSARIVENLERGDGFKTPAAVMHVLGTFDPRVTGMSPWKAIDMSADNGTEEVIDLTSGEAPMARTPEQEARLTKLLDLPNDAFDALLKGAADDKTEETDTLADGMTDEEADAILAQLMGEDDTEVQDKPEEKVPAGAGAALSNEVTVELSNLRNEVDTQKAELAAERWQAERERLVRKGVPPAMLDLAGKVLELPQAAVIDLSGGTKLDASKTIRDILKLAQGTIDLSGEQGNRLFEASSEDDEGTSKLHAMADADSAWL